MSGLRRERRAFARTHHGKWDGRHRLGLSFENGRVPKCGHATAMFLRFRDLEFHELPVWAKRWFRRTTR